MINDHKGECRSAPPLSEEAARASLTLWRDWEALVTSRWPEGSPMANLARRRTLEAELRLLEIQAAERWHPEATPYP